MPSVKQRRRGSLRLMAPYFKNPEFSFDWPDFGSFLPGGPNFPIIFLTLIILIWLISFWLWSEPVR